MKLLLDQNVSHRLVDLLSDLYPSSVHVRMVSLSASADGDIWNYAKDGGFVLVTKDEDFHLRSLLNGPPPKVLWIRSGNCSTELIETLLRKNYSVIEDFMVDGTASFLVLQ